MQLAALFKKTFFSPSFPEILGSKKQGSKRLYNKTNLLKTSKAPKNKKQTFAFAPQKSWLEKKLERLGKPSILGSCFSDVTGVCPETGLDHKHFPKNLFSRQLFQKKTHDGSYLLSKSYNFFG